MLSQICHYMIHAFIIARIVFAYKLSVFYFLIFGKLYFHVKILKHTNLINLCLLVINKKEEDVFGFTASTGGGGTTWY